MRIVFVPLLLRLVLAVACGAFVTQAGARDGVILGASVNPVELVATASVTVPMFATGEAQHAARADVSYAVGGLPALSATYLLRDPDAEGVRTYLGGGVGMAFLTGSGFDPVLSAHALAGGTVPVSGGLGAFGEVVVGGNALANNLRVSLGVNFELGGVR